ncbi:OsmC family protein [Pyxidicoccus fallax]|uniref:OsmC family protein n=1 Tax=Pyxidicoccus fallax TaxID=394095 RepID=A0A848LEY3_9BACT|nr:OsmC family protein [Pyxidicoccus fallax]NMO15405.1 OsmC family protein [Pyxidicoccus fallax]NPC80713.1 OsmC family protein [Pyxidicoccus fallax]
MAGKEHRYAVTVEWTGNRGEGTATYRSYERAHELRVEGKPPIPGSSDPAFRGDPARWNPEELLVASLSACHKLWYLHLCATAGVVVTDYVDAAEGVMAEDADGSGQFVRVVLRPRVTITAGSDPEKARALHHEAHAMCFIARSVNFPVTHEPTTLVEARRA